MVEVQKLHDCMEAGDRAMHGAIAEEQISTDPKQMFNIIHFIKSKIDTL